MRRICYHITTTPINRGQGRDARARLKEHSRFVRLTTVAEEDAVVQNSSAALRDIRAQVVGLDVAVPLLDGSTRSPINFDNAASTPALRPVLDTINEFMIWYSSVHRGTGFKSRVSTQAYEDAREVVGRWVGARAGQHVTIFGKNTTE